MYYFLDEDREMKKIFFGVILFILDGLGMFLFKNYSDLFFPAYRNFSRSWISFLSKITGIFPFSIWDILMVLLFMLAIISLIISVKRRKIFIWFSNSFLVVSLLCFMAVYGWMLNHYAPALSTYLGLEVTEYSVDQLDETCEYYLLKAAEFSGKMERDNEYHLKEYDVKEIGELSGKAYRNIEDEHPIFKGSDVRVKYFSLIGDYLLYNDIVGMFMPLNGEASVCHHSASVQLPFYMCHEAAHRLAIASEQEANFAAFMACISNEDIRFKYSGYYMAFSYCFSSLYKADPERALDLYEKYKEDRNVLLLRLDRSDVSKLYEKYQSKLSDVSDQINDTYLKTFSHEEGIRSYGMVTDYLIAYYLKNVDH